MANLFGKNRLSSLANQFDSKDFQAELEIIKNWHHLSDRDEFMINGLVIQVVKGVH